MSQPGETSFPTHSEEDGLWVFVTVLAAALAFTGLAGTAVWHAFSSLSDRGQFGDMFGVVNATFSGMAFAALVYTLVLQRRELRLQRQELALTRSELSKQARAQQEQAATALVAAEVAARSAVFEGYAQLIAAGKGAYVCNISPDMGSPGDLLIRAHAELENALLKGQCQVDRSA